MKLSFILIFFLSFLDLRHSFGQSQFPDTISLKNMETSVRLKGTRVFLTIPSNYKLREKATSYQAFEKNSVTGIQIIENVNDNFYRFKNEFLKKPSGLKNRDNGNSKAVKIGNFNGFFYTGPFKKPNEKSMILIFGDSSFAVTLIGVFPTTDKITEAEIINTFKTISYDKFINFDPLELENFKFDISITGFKYVPLIGMNSFTYSTDGKLKSIEDERHKSSFEFETYEYPNIERAKKIINNKIQERTEFGISKVSNVQKRSININGYPAFETTMDEKGEYVADSKFYIVIIEKEKTAVLFWGVDRDNGKWIEKYKSTVQSIKFE